MVKFTWPDGHRRWFAGLADPGALLAGVAEAEVMIAEPAAPFPRSLGQARGHLDEDAQRPRCALDTTRPPSAPTGPTSTSASGPKASTSLADHLAGIPEENDTDDDDPPDPGGRPGSAPVAQLCRTARPGLPCLHRARATGQVVGPQRLHGSGLHPRCARRRRVAHGHALARGQGSHRERRLSGNHAARAPGVHLAWEEDGTRGHESVVTIELAETPGGTRLELTQAGFESERARDLHGEGWSSCLDCLEQALTGGAIA
jgi:hypothetical protein